LKRTAKTFHIPSAEAQGAEREKLQEQASDGYEQLLGKYPEQEYWAAQALRSLGNIRGRAKQARCGHQKLCRR